MSTPEQKFRDRWRATLPQGVFLQLIESRTTGVPDAYIFLFGRAIWIEFKVPPYKVDDIQINWHIRHVRAGGSSGVIAPLPVPKAPLKQPQSLPNTASRPAHTGFEHTPATTSTTQKAQTLRAPLKPSAMPEIGPKRQVSSSSLPDIGYWPMDGWSPEEIGRINEYIKSGRRGIEWKVWLKEIGH